MPMETLATTTDSLALGMQIFALGLFALAVLHKARNFAEFSGIVADYRLLPRVLSRPASTLVVALEFVCVATLAVALPVAQFLPSALLFFYAAAMGANLLRGRDAVDCGCGGTPMPLSGALVLRNVTLGVAVAWAVHRSPGLWSLGELGIGGATAVLGFAACAGLIYAAFNQLQANRAVHRRLWLVGAAR